MMVGGGGDEGNGNSRKGKNWRVRREERRTGYRESK